MNFPTLAFLLLASFRGPTPETVHAMVWQEDLYGVIGEKLPWFYSFYPLNARNEPELPHVFTNHPLPHQTWTRVTLCGTFEEVVVPSAVNYTYTVMNVEHDGPCR